MRKTVGLVFIAIVVFSSLMIIKPVYSEIAKPSVPEFTVQYNKSPDLVTVVINNQPFTPPNSSTNIYYNVAFKWHSVGTWNQLYQIQNSYNELIAQSSSEYTNTSFSPSQLGAPNGNQVDIQVQAYLAVAHPSSPNSNIGYWTWVESGWSNTQTITLPEDYLASGSSTAVEREIIAFVIVGLVVVVMLITALVFLRKLKHHLRVEAEWRSK
jgi:hypothetical protein